MKILKNRHYETPFPFPRIFLGDVEMVKTGKYIFTESCKYDIDSDQSDINKLFGFGYGYHHDNSDRIGWRYDPESEQIELLTYVYYNGIRRSKHLMWLEIGEPVEITISNLLYYTTGSLTTTFTLKTKEGTVTAVEHKVLNNISKWFKYSLGGYFGGNRKAPHDIIII